jgi:signal transduction histidine kinase
MLTLLEDFEYYVPEQKHYLSLCKNSALYLLNLIQGILDFSQLEAGTLKLSMTEFNLKEMIVEIIEIISFQKKHQDVELLAEYHELVPDFIYTDKNRFKQVIFNLLSNACKFTFNGSILIKIYMEQVEKNGKTGNYLKCYVIDTGTGIKEEDKSKLFQTFGKLDTTHEINTGGTLVNNK